MTHACSQLFNIIVFPIFPLNLPSSGQIVVQEVFIPVEKIVRKTVQKERIVEVPVEVPVIVEVEKIIHKVLRSTFLVNML